MQLKKSEVTSERSTIKAEIEDIWTFREKSKSNIHTVPSLSLSSLSIEAKSWIKISRIQAVYMNQEIKFHNRALEALICSSETYFITFETFISGLKFKVLFNNGFCRLNPRFGYSTKIESKCCNYALISFNGCLKNF